MREIGTTLLPATWRGLPVTVQVVYGIDGDGDWLWRVSEIWFDLDGYGGVDIRDDLTDCAFEMIYKQVEEAAAYIVERERGKA